MADPRDTPEDSLIGKWATVRAFQCAWDGHDVVIVGKYADEEQYMCERSNMDRWPFMRDELEIWEDM